jgi:hypothetical protein
MMTRDVPEWSGPFFIVGASEFRVDKVSPAVKRTPPTTLPISLGTDMFSQISGGHRLAISLNSDKYSK